LKFDKHGIAKIPKEKSRGITLGLIGGFIGAAVGLSIGASLLGNTLWGIHDEV